jgi:integrase
MTVAHVEVLVEEPSAEAALRILLPKMLSDASFEIYPHFCKDNLLKRLPDRLRGYAAWIPDDWRIVVVVDRDDDDCQELKESLEAMAVTAGLATKSNPKRDRFSVVNRLVIEELEAWYFGDWEAVRKAYPKVNAAIPSQGKYRSPDAIKGGTWESFERVMKAAGYFKTGLRKIEAARAVAAHMDPSRNRSRSFQVLHEALAEMATA